MADPHDVNNYSIGKGILYIAEWSGDTPPTDPTDYDEMGNCPSVEVEPTIERLPHYSSRANFRLKDKNPVVQSDYVCNFSCDEICSANVNKFLLGTLSGATISGLQGTDKEYALKFLSDNPIGTNQRWKMWKCTVSPNGAMALIGDEWMVMDFSAEGLADTANHADSPYFDVDFITTTTTTSTTTTTTTA